MKKVNYTLNDTRYWTCPECDFINETDILYGIDVFPECQECGKKFIWGVDEDTLEKPKIDYSKMDSIEKGASIDGSFGIYLGIGFFILLVIFLIVSSM